MDTIYFYLFITVLLHLLGLIVLGHFEEYTPLPKRFFKVGLMVLSTVLGYHLLGGIGALMIPIGLLVFGLTVHITWCKKHNIHPITAEPKERYYRLRGWQ